MLFGSEIHVTKVDPSLCQRDGITRIAEVCRGVIDSSFSGIQRPLKDVDTASCLPRSAAVWHLCEETEGDSERENGTRSLHDMVSIFFLLHLRYRRSLCYSSAISLLQSSPVAPTEQTITNKVMWVYQKRVKAWMITGRLMFSSEWSSKVLQHSEQSDPRLNPPKRAPYRHHLCGGNRGGLLYPLGEPCWAPMVRLPHNPTTCRIEDAFTFPEQCSGFIEGMFWRFTKSTRIPAAFPTYVVV